MLNNICIDVDYSQLYKDGQKIGGDVFLLNRNFDKCRISATLSDGLGSGVKANVLASLTAHMGHKMSFSPIALTHSAEIIMDTLPIDAEKGISYATFTIAQIMYSPGKEKIDVELVEYDNPESLRFCGTEPIDWDKTPTKLNRTNAIKDEIIMSSHFKMNIDDRLIFFSDGVAQAGIGLGPGANNNASVGAKGWGVKNVREWISNELRENPNISSRDLSRAIVTQAYKYDSYKANDDITCVVVHIRKPRRTLIVTGAPREKSMDKDLAQIVKNYEGNVIVCGGTTSKIIARELGLNVKPDISPSGDLPPASIIDGIDLVTEGMLTLTCATDRLSEKMLLKNMPEDPAKQLIKIMRETDQVDFVVGTKINDAAEDVEMAGNFGIRIPLISRMKKVLEDNYLKEVEIRYL